MKNKVNIIVENILKEMNSKPSKKQQDLNELIQLAIKTGMLQFELSYYQPYDNSGQLPELKNNLKIYYNNIEKLKSKILERK